MSQTIQGNQLALIESFVRTLAPSARDDARQLLVNLYDNLTALSPGGNLIRIGGVQENASQPPSGVVHSVSAANGVATVNITNPPTPGGTQIWHRISYSPLKSFTQNVTTLEPTTATSVTIPQSGVSTFYQLESSFDKKTWSKATLSSTETIDAGLVASQAIEPAAVFNQSNFAFVNSQATGSGATVTVNGSGGTFSPYTAVKGNQTFLRPSATIVGVELGANQFVGYDPKAKQFQLLPTLAGVLPDNLEPVGYVQAGSSTPGGGGTTGGNGGRLSAVQV
jgi:hypothetical protein